MIGELEQDQVEVKNKQTRVQFEIDSTYNELFAQNDCIKLYEKTISDLKKALVTEIAYAQTLKE